MYNFSPYDSRNRRTYESKRKTQSRKARIKKALVFPLQTLQSRTLKRYNMPMIRIKTPVKTVVKKLGVTAQSVYGWKNGSFMPSTSKLVRLAKLEGKTVEQLLK